MSFSEAFKGAKAELATIHAPIDKLKRIGIYARIICAELLATLQIIPYGIRSHALYRSIPEIRVGTAYQGSISTARNLRYGPCERNTLDIYLPAEAEIVSITDPNIPTPNNASKIATELANTTTNPTELSTASKNSQLPVVLFCHGGIWATGEKWHYAPMATRLAQAGIVTAIMSYSLYPVAEATNMAGEVSQALTWTFDNISRFGGDSDNITLTGHSAGAQLCAMALLHRARGPQGNNDLVPRNNTKDVLQKDNNTTGDIRMPRRFVGMAGVYDIAKHYEYEQARAVHALSTMERACGGIPGFDANSPSVILRTALEKARRSSSSGGGGDSEAILESELIGSEKSSRRKSTLYNLHGDLLAQRIGLDRPSISSFSPNKQSACPTTTDTNTMASPIPSLSLSQARTLPPTILQASVSDTTVPWYESSDMHWALHDCGIPSKALIYNRVGHGNFVVNWRPLPTPLDVHTTQDLDEYAADFVNIVLQEVRDLSYFRRKER